MDEVQVSNVVRAPEWIQAASRSQGQEAPLVLYGSDAQKEGGDVSYFAMTMKNVTIDGWVVIVILAVMFVIAVLIMISKAAVPRPRAESECGVPQGVREISRAIRPRSTSPKPTDAPGDAALDESPFMPHLKSESERPLPSVDAVSPVSPRRAGNDGPHRAQVRGRGAP